MNMKHEVHLLPSSPCTTKVGGQLAKPRERGLHCSAAALVSMRTMPQIIIHHAMVADSVIGGCTDRA